MTLLVNKSRIFQHAAWFSERVGLDRGPARRRISLGLHPVSRCSASTTLAAFEQLFWPVPTRSQTARAWRWGFCATTECLPRCWPRSVERGQASRAVGRGRRCGRSSTSRVAVPVFRSCSTTARTNSRYADSSTKSVLPRNSSACAIARLRPEVGLLGHAVFVLLPRLDPRRAQPVMVQHLLEPHRQLPPAAPLQLVRRRRQIVVTKPRRRRPQRPQRALQPATNASNVSLSASATYVHPL